MKIKEGQSRSDYQRRYQNERYKNDPEYREYKKAHTKRSATKSWLKAATTRENEELFGEIGKAHLLVNATPEHPNARGPWISDGSQDPQVTYGAGTPLPTPDHSSVIEPPARGITYGSGTPVTSIRNDELEALREKAWMYEELNR